MNRIKKNLLIPIILLLLSIQVLSVTGIRVQAAPVATGGEADALSTTKLPYTGYAYPSGSKKGYAVGASFQALDRNSYEIMYNLQYTYMVTTKKTDMFLYNYDGKDYYFDDTYVAAVRRDIEYFKKEKGGKLAVIKMYTFNQVPGLTYDGPAVSGVTCYGLDVRHHEANIDKVFALLSQYLGSSVDYWLIGNEINNASQYNYIGGRTAYSLQDYASDYAHLMKMLHNYVSCYNGNTSILLSFDQGWTANDTVSHYSTKDIISVVTNKIAAEGDFCWGLAPQCYNVQHTDTSSHKASPIWWRDKENWSQLVRTDADTPFITIDNLDVLVSYMSQSQFLYKGKIRPILITEIGFSEHNEGKEDEDLQAQAFEKFHNKIMSMPGIISYIYNDQPDNSAAGVWFNMDGHKIKDVFTSIDRGNYTSVVKINYGDVNDDGTYDLVDIVLMRRHIQGIQTLSGNEFEAADINGDGKVDLVDLVFIRGYLMGKRDSIPQR